MKRFKSLLAGLCTLALVVAFAVGSFGYVPAAYAAAGSVNDIKTAEINFGTAKAPAKTVKYGAEFAVPAATGSGITVTVTDPAGKPYNAGADGKYYARMLGNYIIEYKKNTDGITYTYKMLSTLDDELELRIAEADIPSVVKKGKSVVLPEAKVGFYNEDGKWVSYEGAAVKITATAGTEITDVANSYEFKANGTTFIKYVAKLNNGAKHLEKTYEVKVQNEVSDTSAPTLSVSGVPSSASVNTAVTLPVATATHGTDERVKVTVTVKDPNGNPVKDVTVGDDGFATATLENAVEFDNDKTMKFYPTEKGTYEVTYRAEADNEKQSYPRTYRITVSDKKGPLVEIDDTKIPAKWGYSKVTNKTDSENPVEKDTTVTFPFPSKLVDNVTEKGKLTIRFEITDPEKKQAVVVANANSTESGNNKNTIASYEGATDVEFTADNGFTFDFGKYADSKSNDKSYQVAGEYTVKYVVRDEAGVSTTKTYTIELVDEFVDEAAVTVSFDDVPSQTVYASASEAVKYTVPAATVSCENDSRLSVTYKIGDKEVKAGDEYEITEKNNKYYLTIDGTDIEVTSAGFKVEATAVSDTGTSKTASIDVKVFIPSESKTFTFSSEKVDSSLAECVVGNTNLTINRYFKVSDTVLSADDLGIELGFKNSAGAYLPINAEFYVANETLYVRNVSVDNLGKDDTYYLEARAFDRNGFEEVMVYEYVVTFATEDEDGEDSASAIKASSSEVNSSVKLDTEKYTRLTISKFLENVEKNTETDKKYSIVRAYEVKGGKFSVIGDDFTALNTGDYSVVKKPAVISVSDGSKDYASATPEKATALAEYLAGKETTDKLSVSDTSTVKFELAEELVPYVKDMGSPVKIPAGIAYTEFANATVTAKVTKPNGTQEDATIGNTYTVDQNGTYTVTYTAKIDGKEDKTFSYTFKAGNVTAPEFTVEGGKDYTAKIGSTFKFAKINAIDSDADGKAYTYTKTLTLNGTTIASGTGRDYETSSDAITLSESGKYTVTYTVTDEAGNKSSVVYSVTVTSESNSGGISLAALSAILIVVGVLLIAGVIVYLFRFRTVKKG